MKAEILNHSRNESHLALGQRGEQMAMEFLKERGYRIVATNFVVPIGYSQNGRQITGEIDIVAYDESLLPFTLSFIEVKTRSSAEIVPPESAVDLGKQRHIIKAARAYRRLMRISDEPYRYDVIGIVLAPDTAAEINLSRGYFNEQRYERSGWHSR